jgi:hypothetical protein
MRTIGVPYQPSVWFNRLSRTQRKRYSRATQRLERYVYLDRILERRRERVTHVRPTFAALEWVIASAGTVHLADLAEGLCRCEWASELHRQFLECFPEAMRAKPVSMPRHRTQRADQRDEFRTAGRPAADRAPGTPREGTDGKDAGAVAVSFVYDRDR